MQQTTTVYVATKTEVDLEFGKRGAQLIMMQLLSIKNNISYNI